MNEFPLCRRRESSYSAQSVGYEGMESREVRNKHLPRSVCRVTTQEAREKVGKIWRKLLTWRLERHSGNQNNLPSLKITKAGLYWWKCPTKDQNVLWLLGSQTQKLLTSATVLVNQWSERCEHPCRTYVIIMHDFGNEVVKEFLAIAASTHCL